MAPTMAGTTDVIGPFGDFIFREASQVRSGRGHTRSRGMLHQRTLRALVLSFSKEQAGDCWKWTRKEYENYIGQRSKYTVYLVDARAKVDGTEVRRVGGLAVCNFVINEA